VYERERERKRERESFVPLKLSFYYLFLIRPSTFSDRIPHTLQFQFSKHGMPDSKTNIYLYV
jgi:hypothetical protein